MLTVGAGIGASWWRTGSSALTRRADSREKSLPYGRPTPSPIPYPPMWPPTYPSCIIVPTRAGLRRPGWGAAPDDERGAVAG